MKKTFKLAVSLVIALALILYPQNSCAVLTQTALVTDNFTRANSATLGANWGGLQNTAAVCNIVSNKAQSNTASTRCFGIYVASDFPNDQFAQITNSTHANASNFMGPCVRVMPSVSSGAAFPASTVNGYCVNGSPYNISTVTGGTFVALVTSAVNQAAGDVVLLTVQNSAVGPTLTLFVNGTQATTATDVSATAFVAGQPGMSILPDATVGNESVSLFVAGATTSGGPTILNGTQALQLGALLNLNATTSITTTGQAVQFTVPASTYLYGGRLQLIATGQVANPQWTLECSQDSAQTFWFQMPVVGVPNIAPGLGDVPASFAAFYDLTGLSSGATCRFGLAITTNTVITGNVQVWGMVG